MKISHVAVVVSLVVLTVAFVLFERFEYANRREQTREAQREYDLSIFEDRQRMNREILAAKIERVRLTLGESAALTYELCHTHPPTTDKHKRECELLDKRVVKEREKDK